MKTYLTVLAFIITTVLFSQQEFKTSNDYTITDFKSVLNETKNEEGTLELYLFKEDDVLGKLIDIDKDDLDFFLDVTIKVLENPVLTDVSTVIKVEFEFLSCCSNYESLYFLQKTDGSIVKLPQLDYSHCEYATDKVAYVFPSQEFGQTNSILLTESYLDEQLKTTSIKVLETTIWNENDAVIAYSYNYMD